MFNFGTGIVTAVPTGSNPTPVPFGVLQEVNLDLTWAEVELYGEYQFPVAAARGKAKFGGTAKWGRFSPLALNSVFTGSSIATGETKGVGNEPGTIPGTPYQITVTNGATFVDDLGVIDLTTGLQLTRVASSPATGQYSVNTTTGVYTFAAADTTHTVWISYSYRSASTGKTITYNNQLMGSQSTYTLTVFNNFNSGFFGLKLWAVTLSKLGMPMKNDDFTIQDTVITAYADSAARVCEMYITS